MAIGFNPYQQQQQQVATKKNCDVKNAIGLKYLRVAMEND